MNWGEHCTSAFIHVLSDVFVLRGPADGRCRRFTFGIERVASPSTWMDYSACIEFKNWSKLWAQGNATQLLGGLNAAWDFWAEWRGALPLPGWDHPVSGEI